MKLDIDITAFDEILRVILVEDWKNIKQELKRMKAKEEKPPHILEDIKHHKKLKKAYETVIRYTHSGMEAEEILGKKEKCSD